MQKEMDELIKNAQSIVASARELQGKGEYLNLYIFSSKKRDILFQPSAPIDRTAETERLKKLYESLFLPKLNVMYNETKRCIELLSQKGLFYQEKRQKEAARYCNNAISCEKELYRTFVRFKRIVDELSDENIGWKKMKSASSGLKSVFDEWKRLTQDIDNYTSYISGSKRLEEYVKQTEDELDKHNLFYTNKLKYLDTGDILISFKSKKYLTLCKQKETRGIKQKISNRISDYIYRFTDSQVTHVALYVKAARDSEMRDKAGDKPEGFLFHSYGGEFRLQDLEVQFHELWIVLRPRMTVDQRMKLLSVIRERRKQKVAMLFRPFIGVFASGLLSSFFNLFSKRHVHVSLMANSKAMMFCSQFLNESFKEAGIYLTPKSRESGTVYPSDIAASKDVSFLGVLFSSQSVKEKEMFLKEFLQEVSV